MLRELAPEYMDVVSFYAVNIPQFPIIAQQVGLHADEERAVVLFPPKGHHYVVPKNVSLTVDGIREYLDEYLADRIPRSIRSLPVPREPFTRGSVQVAVTSTLPEIIKDEHHDVLLELCKAGSKDCATLGAVVDQVAAATENVTTFKVVRIDVDANEVSALFEFPHVPLLLLFKAQNKTAISYNGVASPANILQMVSKTSSTPFEVPQYIIDAEAQKSDGQDDEGAQAQKAAELEALALEQVSATLAPPRPAAAQKTEL